MKSAFQTVPLFQLRTMGLLEPLDRALWPWRWLSGEVPLIVPINGTATWLAFRPAGLEATIRDVDIM